MRAAKVAAVASLALLLPACFRSSVSSGLPPGDSPPAFREHWHNGAIVGALELDGPHALSGICPAGWSEIHTETNVFQAVISLITAFIYTPQQVTIVCALPSSGGSAPQSEPAPPQPLSPRDVVCPKPPAVGRDTVCATQPENAPRSAQPRPADDGSPRPREIR